MAGFMADAETAMAGDDFDAAAAACEEVLVRDPDHQEALACLDRITAILEERRVAAEREAHRLRVETTRAGVNEDLQQGAFKRALGRIDEFERSEAGASELDDLRARAEAGQRELERREAVTAAVTDQVTRAVRLLSDSDCQSALACLDAALTLDPTHPAATALRLQLVDSLRRLAVPDVSPAIVERAPSESVAEVNSFETFGTDIDSGDALSMFASETETEPPFRLPVVSRAESLRAIPGAAIDTPVVVSVRWPGRASRAVIATLALVPVAAGLWSFWYIARPPVLPVVAAASVEKTAPAPAVALGTLALSLRTNSTATSSSPSAAAASNVARARDGATGDVANARAAAARARNQAVDRYARATDVRPAPAPIVDTASDERAVRTALQSYAGAYAALDVDGVRRVYPSASEAVLRRSFTGIGAQQVEIRDEQMAVAGDAATVSCTWITSSVGTDGSTARARDSRRVVFNLARRGGSWVIVDRR
jgi:hypothetical protein